MQPFSVTHDFIMTYNLLIEGRKEGRKIWKEKENLRTEYRVITTAGSLKYHVDL